MSYKVKIIADTQSPLVPSARITSFEIYAPRFLLAEINTHRILAKSAQSSRAMPVAKRIESVRTDPYIPEFGKNNKGMQSLSELDVAAAQRCTAHWIDSMENAIIAAQFMESEEAHKQWANRVLEPYSHFYGVLTATEWENFWALRTSMSAQPEFRKLAMMMLDAYNTNIPFISDYHLPYVGPLSFGDANLFEMLDISAARCARVSYKNHDGTAFSFEKDKALCAGLIEQGHLSPFDHPATTDALTFENDGSIYWTTPKDQRQYWGWMPYRVDIERNNGWKLRRDSYDPIPANLLAGATA